MKCLGLKKGFKKCKNPAKLFFCRHHYFQPVILLLITIPAIVANYVDFYEGIKQVSYWFNTKEKKINTGLDYSDKTKIVTASEIAPEMVEIRSGEFWMGSDDNIVNALPQKKERLEGFFISKCEITNEQYQKFLLADTSRGKPDYWYDERFNAPYQPVVGISWYDADAYSAWLNRETKKNYSLPTEAQWEKAARGDDKRPYPWGDAEPTKDMANFSDPYGQPMPVGHCPAGRNPKYDTMDMAGNVAEWCGDLKNGTVVRGGSWKDKAIFLRCASRIKLAPNVKKETVGFRLVLTP